MYDDMWTDGSPGSMPPLLNSSNVWATTEADLRALYDCPYTSAVTTRTSLLGAFKHDPSLHQHAFFDSDARELSTRRVTKTNKAAMPVSSLNSLGYSPLSLFDYIRIIQKIERELRSRLEPTASFKTVIFSVTGTPEQVSVCHKILCEAFDPVTAGPSWSMEINLSCPNILGKPPPAYSHEGLSQYLVVALNRASDKGAVTLVPIGLKLPPYTYQAQFDIVVDAIYRMSVLGLDGDNNDDQDGLDKDDSDPGHPLPIAFLTSTNTLGMSLMFDASDADGVEVSGSSAQPRPLIASANGDSVGGMGGASLHPLALGNVRMLRRMLDQHDVTRSIKIIGVGGVSDAAGVRRMRAAGASAVAVGTALGYEGVGVFQKIANGLQGELLGVDE